MTYTDSSTSLVEKTQFQPPDRIPVTYDWLKNASSGDCDHQFMKGTHNETKLISALKLWGNEHMVHKTLLDVKVGRRHGAVMAGRFLNRLEKVRDRETRKCQRALDNNRFHSRHGVRKTNFLDEFESFRFLTIIHEVVNLCDAAAVSSVQRMRRQLQDIFDSVKGIACLGSFEIEVISIPRMREICQKTHDFLNSSSDKTYFDADQERVDRIDKETKIREFRKLEVCEKLGQKLENSLFMNETSQLLVHFHAVVCGDSHKAFSYLNEALNKNANWKIAPWQINMKSMTSEISGKTKSMEDNLTDIAAYITKGGNDWVAGRPYLRLKIRFENGILMSEKETMEKNWRTNILLDDKHVDGVKIADSLSLTVPEINVLAKSLDTLMNLNSTRTGYQFTHGRW